MSLNELLYKYNNNQILQVFLNQASFNPSYYAKVEGLGSGFTVTATPLFNNYFGIQKASLYLDKKLECIHQDCGCLQYYKKKECLHTVALYALAVLQINNDLYKSEFEIYEQKMIALRHNKILNRLSNELKTTNSYFGLIHLTPTIEQEGKKYELSLKIGSDKDYVIKNIYEFITNMENNNEYTYGQKLTFTHSYECLDDVSKELYSFIANISTEETIKSIAIRKPQLLKVLEIYQGKTINYKANTDVKPLTRNVIKTDDVSIVLNDVNLFVKCPNNSIPLVCGVNNAYFIDDLNIYYYSYKTRMEGQILECLFKVNGSLIIDVNSDDFISNLLPIIKNNIKIEDEFYKKYPVPDINVDSYLSYEDGNIYLRYDAKCKDQTTNSPYMHQMLEGYFQVLEGYGFALNKANVYNICNIENQYKFLTGDLSSLKAFGNVFFEDSINKVHAKHSGKTSVNISYNVGLLDFKFDNNNLTPEEIEAMLIAYHQKKQFIKLEDDTIIEIDEQYAKEIDDFLEDFNINIKDIHKPIHKPLNYLLKIVDAKDDNLSVDDKVLKIMNSIQGYKRSKFDLDPKYDDLLRTYQKDGYKWLKTLSHYGFGGILADDMGLGKTIQIISFIESDVAKKPSIIVCPMSLVYNWENECEKWGVKCNVNLIIGNADVREDIIKNINNKEKAIYITSYDSLRRDIDFYKSAKFRFVIADEAQFIKNQFTQKSEAIKTLNSEINYALTGTPIENGLADLWSIFDYLMPGYLSNYSHFKSRYEALIMHEDDEALEKLQKRVTPFILRRTKKDVLSDLPDKIEEYYYCKMEYRQKDVYDAYVAKLKDEIKNGGNNILALITRLRQICITPELIYQEHFDNTKINMALDLIKSSIDANHRILLFSQFSQSFPIISKELEKMGIEHFILDGQTKAKSRMEMVEEFNNNTNIKVFLISLKAGGTGLNLVGADMVIHLDPWWNSSAEAQATDRAYRIGQTKNVYVAKLVCKDTIEEKVIKLQNAKKELADSIINSDERVNVKFSKDDILELLD